MCSQKTIHVADIFCVNYFFETTATNLLRCWETIPVVSLQNKEDPDFWVQMGTQFRNEGGRARHLISEGEWTAALCCGKCITMLLACARKHIGWTLELSDVISEEKCNHVYLLAEPTLAIKKKLGGNAHKKAKGWSSGLNPCKPRGVYRMGRLRSHSAAMQKELMKCWPRFCANNTTMRGISRRLCLMPIRTFHLPEGGGGGNENVINKK